MVSVFLRLCRIDESDRMVACPNFLEGTNARNMFNIYVCLIYVWTDFADLTFIFIPFLDAYIYYVGTHHGNLIESLVTVSR